MKSKLRTAAMIVLLIVFLFSAVQIYRGTSEYRKGARLYEQMSEYAQIPAQVEEDHYPWPEVDFEGLQKVNDEVIAWLFSEGTVINYPVAHGADNDFYLHHLFDKSPGHCGCLFLEAQNPPDFSDAHSIIYGHHMRDGSMFKSLKGYEEQDYYEEHPVLLLVTPEKRYTVELFAGYVSPTSGDAWQLDFADEQEKEQWLEEQVKKSTFKSEVKPTARDRILTLSTCSYEFNNARFVVHGVLREH
jgi:sortase B